MISKELQQYLTLKLSDYYSHKQELKNIFSVSGGSINDTFCLAFESKKVFIKINSKSKFPALFEKEKLGLELLAENSRFNIPKSILIDSYQDFSFYLMEFVESAKKSNNYWESFGIKLAELHQKSSASFGLNYNNHNGSLPQHNSQKQKWSTFFTENRIQFQEKLATDAHLLDEETKQLLSKLYPKLENLFPVEKPALLHGDLWSGNFMTDENGEATIMDPAVYYGHREMDIAMSMLFGGYDKRFYKAYNDAFPLEKDWEKRIDLCNLYPLLVHVNLFGKSYLSRVKSILKKLV